MAEKRSFILYLDYQRHFDLLTNEELGALIRAVFVYEETRTEPDFSDAPALAMCFSFIRAALDRDRAEYEKVCQANRENGKKGGRPKKQADNSKTQKTERLSEKAKKADNDNDNDNVNDNENDTRKPQKQIRHKYGQYQNVLLSDDELEKLKIEFPDLTERIQRLSEYIATSGRTYKNHAAVIRSWARKDAEKQTAAPAPAKIYDLSFLEG